MATHISEHARQCFEYDVINALVAGLKSNQEYSLEKLYNIRRALEKEMEHVDYRIQMIAEQLAENEKLQEQNRKAMRQMRESNQRGVYAIR